MRVLVVLDNRGCVHVAPKSERIARQLPSRGRLFLQGDDAQYFIESLSSYAQKQLNKGYSVCVNIPNYLDYIGDQ